MITDAVKLVEITSCRQCPKRIDGINRHNGYGCLVCSLLPAGTPISPLGIRKDCPLPDMPTDAEVDAFEKEVGP